MRGKELGDFPRIKCNRITPAHAGKSSYIDQLFDGNEDHPRTCGEKIAWLSELDGKVGSPPHMRGKVLQMQ